MSRILVAGCNGQLGRDCQCALAAHELRPLDVPDIDITSPESVAARLRRHGLKCRTVVIHVRDTELSSSERQGKLSAPSFVSGDIAGKAMPHDGCVFLK